ncbi:MAG: hypothetical protein NC308_04385 [Clostridium sp.]|nr:hypothetical protein [Bacteroides sp.]MCM1198105.1 hypothetical protein [Clostridium sp.]
MKNKSSLIVCLAVTGLLLCSCRDKVYFAFENIQLIKEFPINYRVECPDVMKIDAIGIHGIKIYSHYILVSCRDTHGCMVAFSKGDGSMLSRPFLKIGDGPGELLNHPFMCWFTFSDNGKRAGIFDYKGNYIEYDICRSIGTGTASWQCMADSLTLIPGSRYFGAGDNLICRRSRKDYRGHERFLLTKNGKRIKNTATEYLNAIESSERNLLSTLFLTDPAGDIIAELGGRMNVIHIYSMTDLKPGLTLSIGNRLGDIRKLERLSPEQMPKTYYDAKAYDDFFAGLYLDTTIAGLDRNSFLPHIHIFTWDGRPLADISLPVSALYFDIDFSENVLYIVENQDEKILRFDISPVMEEITKIVMS